MSQSQTPSSAGLEHQSAHSQPTPAHDDSACSVIEARPSYRSMTLSCCWERESSAQYVSSGTRPQVPCRQPRCGLAAPGGAERSDWIPPTHISILELCEVCRTRRRTRATIFDNLLPQIQKTAHRTLGVIFFSRLAEDPTIYIPLIDERQHEAHPIAGPCKFFHNIRPSGVKYRQPLTKASRSGL